MGQKCFVTLKRLFESDKEKLNGELRVKSNRECATVLPLFFMKA